MWCTHSPPGRPSCPDTTSSYMDAKASRISAVEDAADSFVLFSLNAVKCVELIVRMLCT